MSTHYARTVEGRPKSSEFQARLDGKQIQFEYAGVGAAFALRRHKERGLPLTFAIVGHHAGRADYITGEPGVPKPLKERLKENVVEWTPGLRQPKQSQSTIR